MAGVDRKSQVGKFSEKTASRAQDPLGDGLTDGLSDSLAGGRKGGVAGSSPPPSAPVTSVTDLVGEATEAHEGLIPE